MQSKQRIYPSVSAFNEVIQKCFQIKHQKPDSELLLVSIAI